MAGRRRWTRDERMGATTTGRPPDGRPRTPRPRRAGDYGHRQSDDPDRTRATMGCGRNGHGGRSGGRRPTRCVCSTSRGTRCVPRTLQAWPRGDVATARPAPATRSDSATRAGGTRSHYHWPSWATRPRAVSKVAMASVSSCSACSRWSVARTSSRPQSGGACCCSAATGRAHRAAAACSAGATPAGLRRPCRGPVACRRRGRRPGQPLGHAGRCDYGEVELQLGRSWFGMDHVAETGLAGGAGDAHVKPRAVLHARHPHQRPVQRHALGPVPVVA